MRVEFERHNGMCLVVKYTAQPGEYHRTEGGFICNGDFLSGHHEGFWDSKLLAFRVSAIHFSDGTPVSSYEQFN